VAGVKHSPARRTLWSRALPMSVIEGRRVTSSGEVLTLERLYRSYAADVARWVSHLAGPGFDRDDLIQDVFLIVRDKLRDFRGDAPVRVWLFRITRKIVANERRRAWRRRLRFFGVDRRPDQEAPRDHWPSAQLDARERAADLHALLATLPERQRQTVILFELEELDTGSIAELMEVNPSTVRVWLHRARLALLRRAAARRRRGEP
jgi:RNA polymerase sigma-70 factor (ECF subfamily)